jgi:predicted DNA binding CopG/RHH family protein
MDKGKPIPPLLTDEDAERFLEEADLSEYDLSGFVPANFHLRAQDARVNMRLPATLLTEVKRAATEERVPYQRLIRQLIVEGLAARQQTPKKAG